MNKSKAVWEKKRPQGCWTTRVLNWFWLEVQIFYTLRGYQSCSESFYTNALITSKTFSAVLKPQRVFCHVCFCV